MSEKLQIKVFADIDNETTELKVSSAITSYKQKDVRVNTIRFSPITLMTGDKLMVTQPFAFD